MTGSDWIDIAYYGVTRGAACLALCLLGWSFVRGWLAVYREEQAQIDAEREAERKRRLDRHFAQAGSKFLQHPYPEHRQKVTSIRRQA